MKNIHLELFKTALNVAIESLSIHRACLEDDGDLDFDEVSVEEFDTTIQALIETRNAYCESASLLSATASLTWTDPPEEEAS